MRLQTDLPLLDLYDGVEELCVMFIRHSQTVPSAARPRGRDATYGAASQNPRAE